MHQFFCLQQDHALTRNLDPFPTLRAAHNIVQSDHVVAGILEARTILFICARRQRGFPRAADPADLIFASLPAGRTTYRLRLRLRFLDEKLPFVH
jgi:hypothetical protein